MPEEHEHYLANVRSFRDVRPTYKNLAETLQAVLGQVASSHAPGAIVQARAKTVASFAEKILRKTYREPLREITDLAGGRVVTYTMAEATAIAEQLQRDPGIEIDRENSVDTRIRLRTGEFGYRALHYVLYLRGPRIFGLPIESGLRNLRVEVQVCTMLQHVWAAIGHDRLYKTALNVPEQMLRDISGVAALLETSDARFGSAITSLDAYIGEFDAYLSPPKIQAAIERWKAVCEADPHDEEAIHSLGRLLIAAGRHAEALACLRDLHDSSRSAAIVDLGRAAWRAGDLDNGRRWLARALTLDPSNLTAQCELAASWMETDSGTARDHYASAFAMAPDDPRVLVPYVECQIVAEKEASALGLLRGTFQHAIAECDRRIALGVRLPESYFERGRLLLYAGPDRAYESLRAYCKAILASDSPPIETERRALQRMLQALCSPGQSPADLDTLRHFEWACRLLTLGVAVADARTKRTGNAADKPFELSTEARRDLEAMATPAAERPDFLAPVVIVAGGCDSEHATALKKQYGELISRGFTDFSGTIICGGTDAGISGMVAAIPVSQASPLVRIGYLPEKSTIPKADREHPAYRICRHVGKGYSPLGPTQTWADLLLAGLDPADIRVFGVNGGQLSGFEYVLATAMGAKVGVVERSGRVATDILLDAQWSNEPGLAPLPEDWATIAAFITARDPRLRGLPRNVVEHCAKTIHDNYRAGVLRNPKRVPARVLDWDVLPDTLRSSCIDQASHIMMALSQLGFDVAPTEARTPEALRDIVAPDSSTPPELEAHVEALAEREHGRYNAERFAAGWRRGEDDASRLTNPSLVPWSQLSADVKDYDRRAVRGWIRVLAQAGYRVVRRA